MIKKNALNTLLGTISVNNYIMITKKNKTVTRQRWLESNLFWTFLDINYKTQDFFRGLYLFVCLFCLFVFFSANNQTFFFSATLHAFILKWIISHFFKFWHIYFSKRNSRNTSVIVYSSFITCYVEYRSPSTVKSIFT